MVVNGSRPIVANSSTDDSTTTAITLGNTAMTPELAAVPRVDDRDAQLEADLCEPDAAARDVIRLSLSRPACV